jgi:hypothetical protein
MGIILINQYKCLKLKNKFLLERMNVTVIADFFGNFLLICVAPESFWQWFLTHMGEQAAYQYLVSQSASSAR